MISIRDGIKYQQANYLLSFVECTNFYVVKLEKREKLEKIKLDYTSCSIRISFKY